MRRILGAIAAATLLLAGCDAGEERPEPVTTDDDLGGEQPAPETTDNDSGAGETVSDEDRALAESICATALEETYTLDARGVLGELIREADSDLTERVLRGLVNEQCYGEVQALGRPPIPETPDAEPEPEWESEPEPESAPDSESETEGESEPEPEAEAESESEPEAEAESEPTITAGQENALRTARSYISVMPFSRTGLIDQLEFEGYSTEDATFAVDELNPDWNEQAAKSAQAYLDLMGFSRSGLIDQLMFEGYTREQAEFGVTEAGL